MLAFHNMNAQNVSRVGASAKRALQREKKPSQSILVVEDEPDVRQLDFEALEESGYQVDTAENGLAALHSLKTSRYDLLIIEDEMSMVTGLELVKKLRSEGILVPVILVLGLMPTLAQSRNQWPQIQAILIKPYTVAELIKTVGEALLSACNGVHLRSVPPSNWQSPVFSRWFGDLRIHR
jgi:two-component system, response regulator, stage 0 sporulation protein F